MRFTALLLATVGLFVLALVSVAGASVYTGDLYYTTYTGSPNVFHVMYTYDDSSNSFSLGTPMSVVGAPGADGIIFDANGNLLVGGQTTNNVYQYTTGGSLLGTGAVGTPSYHLALDPTGAKVYTSDFNGKLATLPLSPLIGPGTLTTITGSESGITQVAFDPGSGNVLYDTSYPNGGGVAGLINLSTGVTTRTVNAQNAIHGMIYDPYTGLITFFGKGYTGTMAGDGTGYTQSSTQFIGDFDQGAVDGQGHALVAGAGAITLIDYRISGDITNPDYYAEHWRIWHYRRRGAARGAWLAESRSRGLGLCRVGRADPGRLYHFPSAAQQGDLLTSSVMPPLG